MPMTLGEQILSGFLIAVGGGFLGRVSGVATFNRICRERQSACTSHMCSEITDIKETQKTIQDDIKKILSKNV